MIQGIGFQTLYSLQHALHYFSHWINYYLEHKDINNWFQKLIFIWNSRFIHKYFATSTLQVF